MRKRCEMMNGKVLPNQGGEAEQDDRLQLLCWRALISSDKNLLIFNCKREPAPDRTNIFQATQIYSLLDQARFFDPDALVTDGPGRTPRKGWNKLPDGWERINTAQGVQFYNHLTQTFQSNSPLADQFPLRPQKGSEMRSLPAGWEKSWDNVGRPQYNYRPQHAVSPSGLENLPSWVPNWATWSSKDPEPFPSLSNDKPRYWASGIARKVHFALFNFESDSPVLRLTGVMFDKISVLGEAWLPEPHILPISRYDVSVLQAWQIMADAPVPNCPYRDSGSRYEAFWRTHMADYAGERRATPEDGHYFEAWTNQGGCMTRVEDAFNETDKTSWQKALAKVSEQILMNQMVFHMMDKGYVARSLPSVNRIAQATLKYKEMRKRIYDASLNRAMFVTEKGYLGLASWNAQEGDTVSVLLGGCTPFILRKLPNVGREQYTLVGEAYVYGIMGGELFDGPMGHARLRAFDIV